MTLAQQAVKQLKARHKTLVTAESCTGGWISKRITDIAGASEVFECGIVCYSNRIKTELLGVRKETLAEFGAVSEQTAREMALGALDVSKADVAVAVTGIAGPDSDNTGKPVGLVYIAVADRTRVEVHEYRNHFTDNVRDNNRRASADNALTVLGRFLDT